MKTPTKAFVPQRAKHTIKKKKNVKLGHFCKLLDREDRIKPCLKETFLRSGVVVRPHATPPHNMPQSQLDHIVETPPRPSYSHDRGSFHQSPPFSTFLDESLFSFKCE